MTIAVPQWQVQSHNDNCSTTVTITVSQWQLQFHSDNYSPTMTVAVPKWQLHPHNDNYNHKQWQMQSYSYNNNPKQWQMQSNNDNYYPIMTIIHFHNDNYNPKEWQMQSYEMKCSLESGDSSVVTRWTVDQEVEGLNPTHGGNLISVVRSLSGFLNPFGKMSTGFRWPRSST